MRPSLFKCRLSRTVLQQTIGIYTNRHSFTPHCFGIRHRKQSISMNTLTASSPIPSISILSSTKSVPSSPNKPNHTLRPYSSSSASSLPNSPNINPTIPDEYDWTKSSASNYSLKYNPIDFARYEYSKSLMDYSYHGYYSTERQERVHNPIVDWYIAIAHHKVRFR